MTVKGDEPSKPPSDSEPDAPNEPENFDELDSSRSDSTPGEKRSGRGESTSNGARNNQPKPQPIELSGRLHRPAKWNPQLELIPRARASERFDLDGELLDDIEEGTPIRVRGVVRSRLHLGGSAENPSPFPPQWTITLHVTRVEVLNDARDVLKQARKDALLHRLERTLREAIPGLEEKLEFKYPKSTQTLVVNYRTRKFMIHGQSRGGQYSGRPHETVGPSYKGFQVKLHLQDAATANAAVVPQTIRRPYWSTELLIAILTDSD